MFLTPGRGPHCHNYFAIYYKAKQVARNVGSISASASSRKPSTNKGKKRAIPSDEETSVASKVSVSPVVTAVYLYTLHLTNSRFLRS